jgi:hypothetical protein
MRPTQWEAASWGSRRSCSTTRRPPPESDVIQAMAKKYPNIGEIVRSITHEDASVVGGGCDDQFEFEFALDLMLDGLERLRDNA